MEFEEAVNCKVGQLVYYHPVHMSSCQVMSAYSHKDYEYLFENAPYVISFIMGRDVEDNILFSLNKPEQTIPSHTPYLENIEFEIDCTPYPMQSTEFLIKPRDEMRMDTDVMHSIENGFYDPSDYLAAIVDDNLFTTSIDDYLSFLCVSHDIFVPLEFDAYVSRNKERLKLGHKGYLENQQLDWQPTFEQYAKDEYKIECDHSAMKRSFFRKSFDFVTYCKQEGVASYGEIIYRLEAGKVSKKILDFFLEEGCLRNKEFQHAIQVGYPGEFDSVENNDKNKDKREDSSSLDEFV